MKDVSWQVVDFDNIRLWEKFRFDGKFWMKVTIDHAREIIGKGNWLEMTSFDGDERVAVFDIKGD